MVVVTWLVVVTGVLGVDVGDAVVIGVVGVEAGTRLRDQRGRRRKVQLADRDARRRIVDRRGRVLDPAFDLVDRGQSAEPRLVDLLEQGHAAGDERRGEAGSLDRGGSGVARRERSSPRPGAAIVVADAPPIAEPKPLGVRQSRLPDRSVAVTLIVPATIAANPSPCCPVKLFPVAAITGMFMAVSWPISWVTLLAVAAVVGEPVLSVVSAVGQRHVHRGDIVLGVIVDDPLQCIGDAAPGWPYWSYR